MSNDLLLQYYPHHYDYRNHANEFRPFVTSFGQSNYRSDALNTDQLGFRVQFDSLGKAIDFYNLKNITGSCNLLIGGSTAFGVDCSSDEKTFANKVAQSGSLLFNWGFRGAVCQQELITYLCQKHLLPDIENIILFTGANDASLVCLNGEFSYPEWGSIFSEDYFFRQYRDQYLEQNRNTLEIANVISWIEKQINLGGWRRTLLGWLARKQPQVSGSANVRLSESERLHIVIGHLRNCLETWSWIARSTGVKIHYVLQPVAGWSTKKLSSREQALIALNIQAIPELAIFTSSDFYEKFKSEIEKIFEASEIQFYDANSWLSDPLYDFEDIFTDSCHLNDRGNELIGELLVEWVFRK